MRIFLTGASGYIGSAVLDSLIRSGHQVTALVRNSERAALVRRHGAAPLIGDLADPAYRDDAIGFDGYVHTAFEHTARGPELDRRTIEVLIDAARRSREAFFIYTSGIWVLGETRAPATEDAPVDPIAQVSWRPDHERRVLEAAGGGLRTVVVRPGIVYGGTRGIVGDLLKDAANGLIRVIGDGQNHWALVYDRDLGELYALLAGRPEAAGVYHANDEGDERVNALVEAIAAMVPMKPDIRRMPLPEARAKMGPYAEGLALDQIVRSPRARALGWTPTLRSVAGSAPRLFEEWRRGREAAPPS
jgi:nucleoside-diphosphate-sugar epimerase